MVKEEIKKPWAVYGWLLGAWGIGKVTSESRNSVDILYIEGQRYPIQVWEKKWVNQFDNPIKAMAYFLVHQTINDRPYDKKDILRKFMNDFPSEEKNIESKLDLNKYFKKSY
ncbi:MAG: hypothetical protein M1416_02925 [Candidatus Pacearchaeota archaeon]|nr:hypothetical protein [Candidatus Pacearchaeota archaeon]